MRSISAKKARRPRPGLDERNDGGREAAVIPFVRNRRSARPAGGELIHIARTDLRSGSAPAL
jgi:hypothetical protein